MQASRKNSILGVIILLGMVNATLNACSCDTISFKRAIEYADEIFVGKITKAELYKNGKYVDARGQEEINWDWRYHFEVRKKWKGNKKSHLIIHNQGNSCDLFFDLYKDEYLVYASRKSGKERPFGVTIGVNDGKNKLSTWLCSRTIYNNRWEDDNWFKDDFIKLDEKFTDEIRLTKFQTSWFFICFIRIISNNSFGVSKNKKNEHPILQQ